MKVILSALCSVYGLSFSGGVLNSLHQSQASRLLRGAKYVYRLMAAAGKAHCYECIMITE